MKTAKIKQVHLMMLTINRSTSIRTSSIFFSPSSFSITIFESSAIDRLAGLLIISGRGYGCFIASWKTLPVGSTENAELDVHHSNIYIHLPLLESFHAIQIAICGSGKRFIAGDDDCRDQSDGSVQQVRRS